MSNLFQPTSTMKEERKDLVFGLIQALMVDMSYEGVLDTQVDRETLKNSTYAYLDTFFSLGDKIYEDMDPSMFDESPK